MTGSSFTVDDIGELFAGAGFPWWVAGGRALDLFIGEDLRPHEDLDVAVLRPDEDAIRRHLPGWDLHVAVAPDELEPWTHPLRPSQHAVWCRPAPNAGWAFELLFNDVEGDTWLFRRDRSVRRDLAAVGLRTDDGTPYLAPEIVLLYKAKRYRPRDEGDFSAVAWRLSGEARTWLRTAIESVYTGHPWLDRLS